MERSPARKVASEGLVKLLRYTVLLGRLDWLQVYLLFAYLIDCINVDVHAVFELQAMQMRMESAQLRTFNLTASDLIKYHLRYLFPMGRIHRHLKSRTATNGRVGATTVVYLASMDSYQWECHSKASTVSNSWGRRAGHTLIKGTIAGGGVIPHIHKSLINRTIKE
ncbi:hypothetical protein ACFE04_004199 [Oxalis oulophora]